MPETGADEPRSAANPDRREAMRIRSLAVLVGLGLAVLGCGGEAGPDRAAPPPDTAGSVSTADSAVGEWIRAAGGSSAWDSVRTLRYTVTTVLYDSTGAVDWMRPRRVEIRKTDTGFLSRIERPEEEGLYVQVFTGDTAWATLNERPLPPDHAAAAESEYVGRDVFYWIGLPWKLRDAGVNLDARALPADSGLEVTVTFGGGVGQHPGDRYYYRFLDDDPWPEQVHYREAGAEDRTRTLWRDFTRGGPITYVGVRRYVDEGGRRTKELRIDDVWVNPPLSDSLFKPPARRDLASPGSRP